MESAVSEPRSRWLVRHRWGLVPTITGILIIVFVAATGGEQGAWLLWLAIPMVMVGLGYFAVVSIMKYFMS